MFLVMKFLLVILIFLAVFVSSGSLVYADDSTAAAELKKVQEYTLPYSGILPDNPLYFLKVTRDRIISLLISDNLKKAEFNLLQADKRLGGGLGMVEKNNITLAESTFSKGLNYLEEGVVKLEDAKKEGKEVQELVRKMSWSLKKHTEVFEKLEKEKGKEFGQSIKTFLERVEQYKKRVNNLIPKE